jgi:hypothetical protein
MEAAPAASQQPSPVLVLEVAPAFFIQALVFACSQQPLVTRYLRKNDGQYTKAVLLLGVGKYILRIIRVKVVLLLVRRQLVAQLVAPAEKPLEPLAFSVGLRRRVHFHLRLFNKLDSPQTWYCASVRRLGGCGSRMWPGCK